MKTETFLQSVSDDDNLYLVSCRFSPSPFSSGLSEEWITVASRYLQEIYGSPAGVELTFHKTNIRENPWEVLLSAMRGKTREGEGQKGRVVEHLGPPRVDFSSPSLVLPTERNAREGEE